MKRGCWQLRPARTAYRRVLPKPDVREIRPFIFAEEAAYKAKPLHNANDCRSTRRMRVVNQHFERLVDVRQTRN